MLMDILQTTLLSLKISFLAVLLQTIPAIYCGYYLTTHKGKLAVLLNTLSMLPLVVTPLAIGYFILYFFQKNSISGRILQNLDIEIIFNWKGAVLAVSLVSLPLYIQGSQIAFASVPKKLHQLSLSLGNTSSQTFFKIILPLSKFGIIRSALLAFARNMGEFGATVIVVGIIPQKTETLASGIFRSLNIPGQENRVQLLIFTSLLISFFFIILIQWMQLLAKKY